MKKERIDVLLTQKGLFESRQLAQRAIMAGKIFINQERIDKPGTKVLLDAHIVVKGNPYPYVSRGGVKLEEALRHFSIRLDHKIMLDIGASTGGFTDCALQHGVKVVYAIDVGYGQLAWKIRQDPRVIVMERTNFRYLKPSDIKLDSPNFATIDVSFISLSLILPPLYSLLLPGSEVVALIKPQFEAGKHQVGKKGIIRDLKVHQQVLLSFIETANKLQFDILGIIPSPILGGEGNIEFLGYLVKREPQLKEEWSTKIKEILEVTSQRFRT